MFRKPIAVRNSLAGVLLVFGALVLGACSPLDLPAVSIGAPGAGEIETQHPKLTHTPTHAPTEATTIPPDEIEFRGQFTAREGNIWVIGEFRVIVTDRTEIKGEPQIGDWLKVHVVRTSEGLVAREIEVLERDATRTPEPGFEFRGQLKAREGHIWVIGEFRVIVTERTEIKGEPQIGDWLKVHAVRTTDGLVAREIEVLEREVTRTPEAEIEFRGQLKEREGHIWVIGEFRVIVTERTEIKGEPQIGDWLKVHAVRTSEGLVAREIEVLEREVTRTPEPGFEFRGQFTAREGNVWVIGEFRVIVTDRTEIKGEPQIGDWLKVHAVRTSEGLVAREIEVLEREVTRTPEPEPTRTREPEPTHEPSRTPEPPTEAPRVEFTGTLHGVSGHMWKVGGTPVIVTGETEIRDNPQVGDTVEVRGWQNADGSVTAREIRKR